jgi:hypothetical protein
LEKEIVSLIQDDYKQEKIIKDLSKRLTAKKLTRKTKKLVKL